MKKTILIIVSIALAATLSASKKSTPGYKDTPILPGTKWHVHDSDRPHPTKVTPGRNGSAPSDAIVLFDGTSLDAWQNQDWIVKHDYMEVKPKSGSQVSKQAFGDIQLHIEWNVPEGKNQHGSNSGIFFMGTYEIQILDSYENVTYADGQAGASYGQQPPLVNATNPPRDWQTYDIIFTAPKFDGDKLISPAYATVFHNGVLIHNHFEFHGKTRHKTITGYKPHGEKGNLLLQDHGDPVRFRNIWVREL